MANSDDEHFDEFVLGVMDASFSTVIDEVEENEQEDVLLHNVSESDDDNSDSEQSQIQPQTVQRPIQNNCWTNVTVNDFGPSHTIPLYNINQGPNLPQHFTSDTTPIEYFCLFFNDDIIDHIVQETNLYANKKNTTTFVPTI